MSGSGYREKRDFSRTPEPEGSMSDANAGQTGRRPLFVIQEHAASTHHFDFRLEIAGVLKSWAIPKGPSTDPRDKRLAIPTEDHPLDYADFEGVIPEGSYGAGSVIVWDRGSYENITEKDGEVRSAAQALKDGHLLVRLHGQKLQGGYALQRTDQGDAGRWLLVKMDDADADARRNPVSTAPKSVLSGTTIAEIAKEDNGG